jgi:hypothetical protein
MKNRFLAFLMATAIPALAQQHQHADPQRQAAVAERGADVMPFDLSATVHVFSDTPAGGVQKVVAKDANDEEQVRLVRSHLRELRTRFLKGDFSGPAHIHGSAMPGLAALRAAPPGSLTIDYREVKGGAELEYATKDPALVEAIHAWFGAQLSDHGHDAMPGHDHGHH